MSKIFDNLARASHNRRIKRFPKAVPNRSFLVDVFETVRSSETWEEARHEHHGQIRSPPFRINPLSRVLDALEIRGFDTVIPFLTVDIDVCHEHRRAIGFVRKLPNPDGDSIRLWLRSVHDTVTVCAVEVQPKIIHVVKLFVKIVGVYKAPCIRLLKISTNSIHLC